MITHLRIFLLLACTFFLFGSINAQTITFDMLKGNWVVNGSRDLKIFSANKLRFNNIDSHCYLRSVWTFDSDTTGSITIKSSDRCPDPQTSKFTYQLFECAGYGAPIYKMDVHFENGTVEKLALSAKGGQKKLEIGYNQAIVESMATDDRVWIYFSMKKKD
jgi:hypothetical protein